MAKGALERMAGLAGWAVRLKTHLAVRLETHLAVRLETHLAVHMETPLAVRLAVRLAAGPQGMGDAARAPSWPRRPLVRGG